MISLQELLTEVPSPDGNPLFKSAAEMGRQISALPASHYKGNGAASFLTQVFRGIRSCPSELTGAILEIVQRRLASESDEIQGDWRHQIARAIHSYNQDFQKAKKAAKHGLTDDELFDEILSKSETADEHFIVTAKTAEQSQIQGKGGALRDTLIKRLHLFEQGELSNSKRLNQERSANPLPKYTFLLPQDSVAIGFWKNLFKRIVFNNPFGTISVEKASEKLTEISESLRVYVVQQPAICGVPIAGFDVERSYGSAYSFCFDEMHRPKVIKWDQVTLGLWRANVVHAFDAIRKEPFGWNRMLDDPEIKQMIESSESSKKHEH